MRRAVVPPALFPILGQTKSSPSRRHEFAMMRWTMTHWLTAPATEYQARVTLQSFEFDPKIKPSIRRLAVVYPAMADGKGT